MADSRLTAQPPTVVSISGTLTGISGVVELGANVRGEPAALTGKAGSVHVIFGSPVTFGPTGDVAGDVVDLDGFVEQAAFQFLIGTPVAIMADGSSGEIDLALGPIPPGAPPPLVGVTLTFDGIGHVRITGN